MHNVQHSLCVIDSEDLGGLRKRLFYTSGGGNRTPSFLDMIKALCVLSVLLHVAAGEEPAPRALYQVRPASRGVKLAKPARASFVFSKILDWAVATPENAVAIAGTKLRPKATALVEVATGNFNDPTYCEGGVAIKILGFAGLKKQDWFSDSDPYVKLTAKSSYGNVIKSKKGKEHPATEPLSNTHDKKHWNQYFCFPSGAVETIKVELWDKDHWTKDDIMGEVAVDRASMEAATEKGGKSFDLTKEGKIVLRFKVPADITASAVPVALNSAGEDKAKTREDAKAKWGKLSAGLDGAAAVLNSAGEDKGKAREDAKAKWGKLSAGLDGAAALNSAGEDKAKAREDAKAKWGKLSAGLDGAAAFLNSAGEDKAKAREDAKAKWGKLSAGLDGAAALNSAGEDKAKAA